jgi:hypothetical protein
MDSSGRFIVYVTNFNISTSFGTHDSRLPVTEINVFLFDRLLGITTRVTVPPSTSAVVGEEACCEGAGSRYAMDGCSIANRLKGRCCDQKPCRIGGLNPEISSDGKKIVFVSDVDYVDSGTVPKGDLEIWVHDIPSSTTYRITHTNDKNVDETSPHISGDGSVVSWQSKTHYLPSQWIEYESMTNFDIHATHLTYGCDDPLATNYHENYDIPVNCTYPEPIIIFPNSARRVKLTLTPLDFDGNPISHNKLHSLAAEPPEGSLWCHQWQEEVKTDLAGALRVHSSRFRLYNNEQCGSNTNGIQVTIDILSAKYGEEPTQLVSKLTSQFNDTSSRLWRGYATRYLGNIEDLGKYIV